MATLTACESEILALSWECFKTDSSVNYAKLGEFAGLKNSASAKTAYHSAKKKMQANGASNCTAREREMLVLAWKCFNTPPQVDYAKLAEKSGSKNEASTKTAFCAAKKKLLADADSSADGTNASKGGEKSTASAKKTRKTLPSARNKTTAAEEGDSIVEAASPSPAKKRKRANGVAEPSPKSAAILAAVANEGEGGDEEEQVPKKKTKRSKGKKARSELGGNGDEIKTEQDGEEMVQAGLFESAQEFLKEEED